MTPIVTLTLVDGTRVVVPDSLDLITPYVLREQQDWFEEEIRFLRRLIEPGQKAIDIGANYGVYTVSIARVVGPAGHVWAFEPASATANLLAQSIRANGFSQVTIEQRALSSEGGTAQLSLEVNAELNALQRDSQAAGASEPVSLTTLDDRLQAYGWQEIDFLKIDAEGEEARILAGGAQFFARLSPLVQFETSSGTSQNLSLVDDFAARGYDAYRLVPALDALVPYDRNSRPEEAPLNLFCCKPDRARRLAARGVLIEAATLESGRDRLVDAVRRRIRSEAALGWRRNLASLPYGAMLADAWERRMQGGRGAKAEEALALYALSRDIGFVHCRALLRARHKLHLAVRALRCARVATQAGQPCARRAGPRCASSRGTRAVGTQRYPHGKGGRRSERALPVAGRALRDDGSGNLARGLAAVVGPRGARAYRVVLVVLPGSRGAAAPRDDRAAGARQPGDAAQACPLAAAVPASPA